MNWVRTEVLNRHLVGPEFSTFDTIILGSISSDETDVALGVLMRSCIHERLRRVEFYENKDML